MTTVRPHVVLLDLRMPGTPGLEGLAYLRAHHRAVPVIIVSGSLDHASAEAARAAGAFDVLAKPFDIEVLGPARGAGDAGGAAGVMGSPTPWAAVQRAAWTALGRKA
jgi:CheY-like chemotaxis protein